MHTMEVFQSSSWWFVRDSNPIVKELFGTDTIPTAYTTEMPHNEVVNRLQKLNPDYKVF